MLFVVMCYVADVVGVVVAYVAYVGVVIDDVVDDVVVCADIITDFELDPPHHHHHHFITIKIIIKLIDVELHPTLVVVGGGYGVDVVAGGVIDDVV